MSVEYAPKGLLGVLTPQANTTVEPEFGMLLPAGFASISARLTSPKATVEERLVDYYESLDDTLVQFANAPLGVIGSACTGSSYLIGAAREDEIFGRLSRERGIPVTNAALAVVEAFRALGADRVGLVSPYPERLTEASAAYWESRGLSVAAITRASVDASTFHPIYSIRASGAAEALASMAAHKVDAIVMLGSGMPTLGAILGMPRVGGAPVFSCVLALAWHMVQLARSTDPEGYASLAPASAAESLLQFIGATEWRHRYADRCWRPA